MDTFLDGTVSISSILLTFMIISATLVMKEDVHLLEVSVFWFSDTWSKFIS